MRFLILVLTFGVLAPGAFAEGDCPFELRPGKIIQDGRIQEERVLAAPFAAPWTVSSVVCDDMEFEVGRAAFLVATKGKDKVWSRDLGSCGAEFKVDAKARAFVVESETCDYYDTDRLYSVITVAFDASAAKFNMVDSRDGSHVKEQLATFKRHVAAGDLCAAREGLVDRYMERGGAYGSEIVSNRDVYQDLFVKALHQKAKALVDAGQVNEAARWLAAFLFRDLTESDAEKAKFTHCLDRGFTYHSIMGKRVREVNDFGYWLWRAGWDAAAIPPLLDVVKNHPKRAVAWLNLGDAALAAGHWYVAKWAYDHYRALSPKAESLPALPSRPVREAGKVLLGDRAFQAYGRLDSVPDEVATVDTAVIGFDKDGDALWIPFQAKKDFILDMFFIGVGQSHEATFNWLGVNPNGRGHWIRSQAGRMTVPKGTSWTIESTRFPEGSVLEFDMMRLVTATSDTPFEVNGDPVTSVTFDPDRKPCSVTLAKGRKFNGVDLPPSATVSICHPNQNRLRITFPSGSEFMGKKILSSVEVQFGIDAAFLRWDVPLEGKRFTAAAQYGSDRYKGTVREGRFADY